ncbi:malaria antigen [Cinnamomum micranthum f. kanehirae]|uniref:Malaria antigen n=1 Tax=Cinnamomum micranthum f. kanehirae TaxID=337451 RepID=A0A3S4PEV0_9MAGN|nr:malaria antigen [Cinnamomum micranthum f. kanehirae]
MGSTSKSEEDNQRSFDREIRNMILTLTNRLTQIHSMTKHGSSHRLQDDEVDESGIGIITLAGNNTGATMKADLRDKLDGRSTLTEDQEMQETLGTYANSNYQAVNNSIMLGGSHSSKDPGIHIVVSDCGEEVMEKLKEKESKKEQPLDGEKK